MESIRDVQVRLFFGVLVGIAGGVLVADALPFVIWWFAIPIGAVLGGAVFAAPEIRKAAPVAARSAWQSLAHLPVYWRRYQEAPLERRRKWQISVAVFSSLFIAGGLLSGSAIAMSEGGTLPGLTVLIMMVSFISYILLAVGPVFATANRKVPVRAIVFASPPGPFLFIAFALVLSIRFFGKTIWRGAPKAPVFLSGVLRDAAKFAVRFSIELFWQVNSRPLAITAIGSGAGVGVFFPLFRLMWQWEILPAAIVGAPIGAVVSLAYYQFRPQRVLKAH